MNNSSKRPPNAPSPVTQPKHSTSSDPPDVLARIHEGLPLVDVLAGQLKRQLRTTTSHEELVSFGREGLLGAARNFDASRGVPFRCWAALRVRGAIVDGVRSLGNVPRRMYRRIKAIEAADRVEGALIQDDAARPPAGATAADARLSHYLESIATAMAVGILAPSQRDCFEQVEGDDVSPEEAVANRELAGEIRAAVARLPAQERHLVESHYFGDSTLDDAARALGLSKSWGSRLHARAIEMIGRDLKRSRIQF